jgi:hypothetical protein
MSYLLKIIQHLSSLESKVKMQLDPTRAYQPAIADRFLLEYSPGPFVPRKSKFVDNRIEPSVNGWESRERQESPQGPGVAKGRFEISTLLGLEMELIDRLARSLPDWASKELKEGDYATYNELAHVICNIAENGDRLHLPANATALAHDMLRTIIQSEAEENSMRMSIGIKHPF